MMSLRWLGLGRMRLQQKLTVNYAAVGVMITTLCIGATTWVQNREEALNIARAEAVRLAEETDTRIDTAYEECLTYVLTGDPRRKENALRALALAASDVTAMRTNPLSALAVGPLDALERALTRGTQSANQIFEHHDRGGTEQADGKPLRQFEQSMDVLADSADRLIPAIQDLAALDSVASSRLIRWCMLAIGALGIAAAITLGHLLGRRIVGPLRRLRDAAVGFGRGNFDLTLNVAGADETAELARAFHGMATNIQGLMSSLAEQRAHLEDIFESMTELLIVATEDGVIVSANRSACLTLGYQASDLKGKHLRTILQSSTFEDLYGRARSPLAPNGAVAAEITLRTMDNRPIPALGSVTIVSARAGGGPSGDDLVLVLQDLRERQHLESELRQAQKLEAIGRLASGIAHEINTPIQFLNDSLGFMAETSRELLTIVGKYRQLPGATAEETENLLREINELEASLDYPFVVANLPVALAATKDGIDRITNIVSSMKQFAHPGDDQQVACDLNEGVASTVTIARSEYRFVAELEADLGDLPSIVCFPGELNQVVLNLIVNAAHAIADVVKDTDHKGRIVVRTRSEGNTVVISVSDTGAGIPDSVRERIFDPFFTTKEVGKGTGQGLAIARSVVVDKHGGTITFQTEIGKGTTFVIRLPVGGMVVRRPVAA
ncbi:MAG: two-component system, NtrC family, sensor kinase [Myxococcales bacterium]|jgi:PAS domain S-box-containing protein|nr:two-component system, NtrC family, sensor kinase [Myxococcales bacterium]